MVLCGGGFGCRLLLGLPLRSMDEAEERSSTKGLRMTPHTKTAEDYAREIREALEKGPEPISTDLLGDRYMQSDYSMASLSKAQDAFIAACHPTALRSILTAREEDARAVSLLRDECERLRAELEAAQAWKARVIKAADEAHGPDAIRFKLSLLQNGRARNHFPSHLDGRWVSFVYAENDAHIGYIAKALDAAMKDQA